MTLLAEGVSLKDSSNILAKIAPAHSNASMILEREAHMYVLPARHPVHITRSLAHSSLDRIAETPESANIGLRLIDFFCIAKSHGDCLVLLLAHPGLNLLGRYFPPSKVNTLLLADVSRARPSSSHADIYMMGIEEPEFHDEMEAMDIMDLASFLEYVPSFGLSARSCSRCLSRFAIQATRCLEMMHK